MSDLQVHLLSGETIQVQFTGDERICDLRKQVGIERAVPPAFVKILSGERVLNDKVILADVLDKELYAHIMDSIPFQERLAKEGSAVLVDGIPAVFDYMKGSWGSSGKIRFRFYTSEKHPEFGSLFQTKDWTFLEPGLMVYRCGKMEVQLLLPAAWTVTACSVLVRKQADLDSEEVQRLPTGTKVEVVDGLFLKDDDSTPRLRIASPVRGWITAYLRSSNLALLQPPESPNLAEGAVAEIMALVLKKLSPEPLTN